MPEKRAIAVAVILAGALAAPARGGSDPVSPSPLEQAIRRARDEVFPKLVFIRPVFDLSREGQKIETSATGSGVIISADGLVVTNFHVAGTAKRLVCTLSDRRRVTAELVGADAATDVALLRLRLAELRLAEIPFARFGSETDLEAGDFVMALGSPLGLTRSLSLGVVSCRDRYLPPMVVSGHVPTGLFNTWIQTDAAINPGNSGGPLVDLAGRIVGINARGYRGAENLGFSIPASVVAEVVESLLASGRVSRSRIGLTCQPLKEMSGRFASEAGGVLVSSVDAGSPAAEAGIEAGNIMLSYDGQPVSALFDEDMPAVARLMAGVPVGKRIEVVVRRGEEVRACLATTVEWQPPAEQDQELGEWGLTLRGLTDRERRERRLDDRGGVLVTGVRAGGSAFLASPKLLAGDVLLEIDGAPAEAAERVRESLERAAEGGAQAALLKVKRGHGELLIALPFLASQPATEVEP
ncbi:MAG: trypsin-like peptidase domain-containing protein [Planctomycetes bacterium]|nr:trypsin-like peptidase domain-containing protein [Planctomycetota bacterium]